MKDLTDPQVSRTRYGSVVWPEDTTEAWFMLCDLARVAPDHYDISVDELIERLRKHGENTHRKTVERIVWCFDQGWPTWR